MPTGRSARVKVVGAYEGWVKRGEQEFHAVNECELSTLKRWQVVRGERRI